MSREWADTSVSKTPLIFTSIMDWTIDQSQALKTRIISSPWLEEMVAFKDGMLALLLASGL